MAGVGEASAILSLIVAAKWVVEFAQDLREAQDERRKLLRETGRLTLILGSIYDRLKDYQTKAKPADNWYTNLLVLAQGCGTIEEDGSIKPWPGSTGKPEGALARLQVVIGQLLEELQPAQGAKKVVQTLKYKWDSKRFDSMFGEIMTLTAEIGALLDADQFKLLISLKDDGEVNREQLKNIQDRVDIDAINIQKLLADSEASTKLNGDTNVKVGEVLDGQKASADVEQKHFAVSRLMRTDVEQTKEKIIDMSDHIKASEAVGQVNLAITQEIRKQGIGTNQELYLIKDNLKPIGAMGLKNFRMQKAVKRHAVDTNERVRMIEQRQRQEQEEREREREEKKKKELEAEKKDIEEWLSPLKDLARQYEISGQCYPLGQWLLDSVAFRQWVQGRHWYLQLDGEAGSGKTVLASRIASHLQQHVSNPKVPVICLFLDHKDSKNQTRENLFGSLLKQLLQLQDSQSVELSPDLRTLHRNAKNIGWHPKFGDICRLLQIQLNTYDRVYIIVDALDECPLQVRSVLQRTLRQFGTDRISVIFTSRFADTKRDNDLICNRCKEDPPKEPFLYYRCNLCLEDGYAFDVCQDCRDMGLSCKDPSHVLTEPYASVEIDLLTSSMDTDIERYVRWEIGKELEDDQSPAYDKWTHRAAPGTTRLQRLCHASPKLMDDIPPIVVARADHRFLFAKLYMDILRVQTSGMAIRKALEGLPKDLDAIYDDAMQRIDAQDKPERDLAHQILAVLVCAHRNLRVGELKHALAVQQWPEEFGTDMWNDNEGFVGVSTILECTLGLISISDIEEDLGAVRMHRTLQEYLSDRRMKYFPEAEKNVAAACLTYLELDAFSKPSLGKADFDARKKRYPFISYASQYWGDHIRDAGFDEKLQARTFELVCDRSRVATCAEAAWMTGEGGPEGWDVRKGLDGLHVCAWYGLSGALSKFGSTSLIVDVTEPTFLQTPLMYACRKGHVEVVRQLLDLGASIHATSTRGRTPWFEAVEEGRDEVVALLLARSELGININSVQHVESSRTALMQASNLGYESIVRKLLEHTDIEVNRQDDLGYTALSLATVKHFHSVVELLLMHPHIEVDIKEFKNGRSALVLAAERDDAFAVDMLLQNGADWQLKDRQGGTAALRAVDYGCALALNVLKSDKASLRCVDEDSRTLLHGASRGGHPEILSLLVKEGLEKDAQDNNGLTPLHEASRQGRPEVIKVLLELGADSTLKDKFDRTPFTVAWQYGHRDIMDMFPHEGQPPNDDALPIWALARRGLKGPLEKALELRKSDALEREPCIENSPLHCAVFATDPEILRMLLEEVELPRNSVNHVGRSALHTAAFRGNLQAAKYLIDHEAKLDPQDRWGDTPLTLSRSNHHYPLMIALVEAGAPLLDLPRRKIQDIFFRAAEVGSVKAATRLLDHGATTNDKDVDGRTAMDIARDANNGELLQVLQSTQTFFQRDSGVAADLVTNAEGNVVRPPPMPSCPSSQRLKLPFRSPELDLDLMGHDEFDFPSVPTRPVPTRLVQPVLEGV